jgi:twitching motility protein PilI
MSEQSAAFHKIVEIAQDSRRTASGLPPQVDIKPQWSGIGFSLLGRRFVAPIEEVSEMLEVPRYTHLPGVQRWVRGVANVRGRLLPIADMAAYLGHQLEVSRRQRRIMVIEKDDIYSGLIVDASFGMQHFLVDSYSQVVNIAGLEGLELFLQGRFLDDFGDDWVVFSPFALTTQEKFFQTSATR